MWHKSHLNQLFMFVFILIVPNFSRATSSYPPPANIRITNIPELNNEEQVWICPTDSNIIISDWRDFRLGYRQVAIGRSTDGGLTWSDSLISPDMQAFAGISWQSDPTLTVDRLGNFYISVLDFDPFGLTNHSFITFYKTINQGVSWTGPVHHLPGIDTSVFEDKQFITVDRTGGVYDGNIYCAWARFTGPYSQTNGPTRMAFIRSIDGGASFEDSVIVGPPVSADSCENVISAGQFPIPVVASNGDVHVFWLGTVIIENNNCNYLATYGIKKAVSIDGGQTFSPEEVIFNVCCYYIAANGINVYPNPAADADISGGPFDGNMYIAFTNYAYDAEDTLGEIRYDVDFIRSTDNAATWSSRLQIDDDISAPLSDSYHPWLIVNEEGVVIVVFYDTRYDPPAYLLFDLMAAYSFDGGLTFTSNHRISSASSDAGSLKRDSQSGPAVPLDEYNLAPLPISGPRAGLIGEYVGVTAFHDKVNAVWTDSRDGNSEIYTANWYLPILEPRLIAPVDSFVAHSAPPFVWATSWKHNQDRYRFEISDDPTFTVNVTSITSDTNSATLGSSLPDGDYYWRVKSLMVSGQDSSAYSETRVLIIDNTPPSQTQLLLPEDSSVTNNPLPLFDWSDVVKAAPVEYDLSISTDITFPAGPNTRVYPDLITSEFKPDDSLDEGVVSFWKVAARDEADNESVSDIFRVTYLAFLCGDVNNDGSGPNILDLNYFVNFIFRLGPAPQVPQAADLNGSGGNPNILDMNMLVNYIFRLGPLPTCGL
jgi:hypothetical protein